MSDESPTTSAVVANATQALAMKDLRESIDGLRKQVKVLWIAVAVIGVLTVVLAGSTLAARFLGVRTMGGRFQGRGGTFNGQQLDNGTGSGGVQQQTAPTQ